MRDRNAYKEEQYDRLASIVRENLNMEAVYKIIEKGNEASCSLYQNREQRKQACGKAGGNYKRSD